MRREALQSPIARSQQKVRSLSFPAPFGGWNTRDPISEMAVTDAVKLTNAIAFPGRVSVRKGITEFATDIPSGKTVETLMPYNRAGSGSKLFAATDAAIYDVTAGGTAISVVPAMTNGRWQYVNFANSAGQYLIAVNGEDELQRWDGSTWFGVPALDTGFPTTDLVDITVYNQKLFFVVKDSMELQYLPAGQLVGPTVGRFYVGQVFSRGGYVMAIANWTVDGGRGSNDYLVVISSEGEVAVYSGTDPSTIVDWALQGVYYIGRPVGRRCTVQYGGDLLLLTDRGIFPLAKALQSSSIDKTLAITDKIEPTFVSQATALFSTFGWEAVINTQESFLLVNVPVANGSVQYVMHLQSQAWSDFTGWDAKCWAYFGGQLYCGMLEKVGKAYSGASDFDDDINCDIVPAFNYWGDRGQQKHVKMLRPTFSANGSFAYSLEGCTDFVVRAPTSTIAPVASPSALWGVALWGQAYWGSSVAITREWQTVFNSTHSAFTPFLRIATSTVQPSLLSLDYAVEIGGLL